MVSPVGELNPSKEYSFSGQEIKPQVENTGVRIRDLCQINPFKATGNSLHPGGGGVQKTGKGDMR